MKHFLGSPFYTAAAVPIAGMVSIGASHTLLGIALGLLLWRRDWIRWPRAWAPVVVFLGGTLLSLALSADPAAGLPQLKKFYVWTVLVVVLSGVTTMARARWTLLGMAAAGCTSAAWGLVQYAVKYERARSLGVPFYQAYIGDRITGFNSHWMTFSAQMMVAFLIVVAFLMFAHRGVARRYLLLAAGGAALLGLAMLLALTRNVWGAAAVATLLLIWHWRRAALLAVPVVAGLVFVAAPESVQQRVESMWRPNARLDSNMHRTWLRAAGYRMVAAHPLLGVGAEQVGRHVLESLPAEAPQPWPNFWYYGHLHNFYLQFAAERGLPVMLALVAFLVIGLRDFLGRARRLEPNEHDRRFILLAAAAVIIGIMVGGWWEHNLGDSEVLGALLAVMGCGYAAVDEEPCADATS